MPLLTSIFVAAILGTLVLVAALRLLVLLATNVDLSLAAFSRIELLFLAACVGFWLWACVGVWRAAHQTNGKGRWLSRGGVILATIAISPHALASAESAGELALLAIHRDPLGPPGKVSIEGDVLAFEGAIAQGTAEPFRAALQGAKRAKLLVLSSEGGRIVEALRIAEAVRARGIDTFARGECSSACTIILLAGRNRAMDRDTGIGFHRISFSGYGPLDEKFASEELRQFYVDAGVTSDFVDAALSTPSNEIWYPSEREMLDANVLTSGTSDGRPVRERGHGASPEAP